MGHIKANCTLLSAKNIIQVPAPTSLRITEGRQGGVETPRAKGRAFQIMVEEAREEPTFIVGFSYDRGKAPT